MTRSLLRHGVGTPAVGQVRWVELANLDGQYREPGAAPKIRPAVLVSERPTGAWRVLCLTSQPIYRTDGKPRVALRHWATAGLRGPSYLWSTRLTSVSLWQLDRLIGWLTSSDARLIAQASSQPPARALRRLVAQAEARDRARLLHREVAG